ncbi:MAG: hypothetical protein ABIL09_13075, partial [Gemmatimonadota bacterium]
MSDETAASGRLCPDLETWCAYVDRTPGGAPDRERLAAHLAGCDRCAAIVASLRRELAAAETAPEVRPPSALLAAARQVGSPPAAG